jgi:hypothetical protein
MIEKILIGVLIGRNRQKSFPVKVEGGFEEKIIFYNILCIL